MSPEDAVEYSLSLAESNLEKAFALWDAADAGKCRVAGERVRAVAQDLLFVQQAIESDTDSGVQLKNRLLQLGRRVSLMIRVVDAAAAFWRGLDLRTPIRPPDLTDCNSWQGDA